MEQRAHTLLRLLPWCVAGPLPLGGHCIECAQRPLWKGLGRHAGQGPLSLISPLCSKIMSQHHPQTRRAGGGRAGKPLGGQTLGSGSALGSHAAWDPFRQVGFPRHYRGCKQMVHGLSSGPGGFFFSLLCLYIVTTKPELDASL